jgi:uncharacterized protein (UPF0333 family)
MFKNKIFNFIIFTTLVFVLFFAIFSLAKADSTDSTLPDNVKITSSSDGSSTTVVINSKPGFITNVQTNCVNGKCTHNATSTALKDVDIKKMQDNIKSQQEAMEKFWKIQEDLFKQQEKMFQDLWGINWF